MLTAAFPKLANMKITHLLRAFFRSAIYPAVVVALMICAEVFGLEFPIYYIYFVLAVLCVLFCEDTLGILPIVCCLYMTVSAGHNPGFGPSESVREGRSIFFESQGVVQLFFLVSAGVVLLVGKLIMCIIEGKGGRGRPKLLFGFIALTVGYVLAGVTFQYEPRSVAFGLVQIACLTVFYFYFFFTVDWSRVKESYIFTVFIWIGIGVLVETAAMYFAPGVIQNGKVAREHLYVGWGTYNNVGCIMAMCVPAPFYFAAKKKNGWLFTLLGCLLFGGVVLTQSRSAILFGTVVFLGCIVVMMIKANKRERIANAILFGVLAVALVILGVIFRKQVQSVFSSLTNAGFNSAGRLEIYRAAWDTFLSSPLFGKGFYHTPGGRFGLTWYVPSDPNTMNEVTGFVAPRAHNTVLQLLAMGGVFALLAYLYHRFETLWLLFRKPTTEKTFIALCIAALLLTSLLDVHFFNFGPCVLYSILLVCAERPQQKTTPTNLFSSPTSTVL